MAKEKPRVQLHYKKSSLFRVIHADGAWGGLTPDLNLFFAFFNSRPPIPEMVVQEIEEDGAAGKEIPELKVSKGGIVRELEVGVVMNEDNIQHLIAFLQERLDVVRKLKKEAKASEEKKVK